MFILSQLMLAPVLGLQTKVCRPRFRKSSFKKGDSALKPKIIVMQTVDSTLQQCREILTSMGLREGKDFLLFDQAPDFENFEPDSRQLFVTGSFSGLDSGVEWMVATAKDQNKELVAVSFSTHKIAGPFDAHIPKVRESLDACFSQFRGIVQRFLEGTLVRTA